MWVDLFALFVAVFFTAMGFFKGSIFTFFTFLAALSTYLGAGRLARWIETQSDWSFLDPSSRYWFLLAICAVLIYFSVNLIGLLVSHFAIGKQMKARKWDGALGLALGTGQGVMIGLFAACLVGASPQTLRDSSPWFESQREGSRLVSAVHPWNPVRVRQEEMDWLGRLAKTVDDLDQTAKEADKAAAAAKSGTLNERPEVQAILKDPGLVAALKQGEYARIFAKDRWRRLVMDSGLKSAVDAPRMESPKLGEQQDILGGGVPPQRENR